MWDAALCALHLCAWCQAAVLVRAYLSLVFGTACALGASDMDAWMPCATSPGLIQRGGGLFEALPANVLGCFIMGLLSPPSVLAAREPRLKGHPQPLALLPARAAAAHSQPHLLLGLRTGFCGSLTTYASWVLQMVRMMAGGAPSRHGTEWVAALAGLFVGTACALLALELGQQAALALWGWHSRPRAPPSHSQQQQQQQQQQHGAAEGVALKAHEAGHEEAQAVTGPEGGPTMTDAAAAQPAPTRAEWAAHGAAAAVLCTLTAVAVAYAVADVRSGAVSGGRPRAHVWLAVLMAPPGCVLRWQLARLNNTNGLLQGTAWAWLPAGTMLANQLACLVDFMAAILLVRLVPGRLSLARHAALYGAIAGFSGALSTVSTWVVEIQQLNAEAPGLARGTRYSALSLACSVLLGLVSYGTAVWTL